VSETDIKGVQFGNLTYRQGLTSICGHYTSRSRNRRTDKTGGTRADIWNKYINLNAVGILSWLKRTRSEVTCKGSRRDISQRLTKMPSTSAEGFLGMSIIVVIFAFLATEKTSGRSWFDRSS
jgi:hypothetical protein